MPWSNAYNKHQKGVIDTSDLVIYVNLGTLLQFILQNQIRIFFMWLPFNFIKQHCSAIFLIFFTEGSLMPYLTVKFVCFGWESAHRLRNIHLGVSWECLPKQSMQICLSVHWRCLKIFDLASAFGFRKGEVSFSPVPCQSALYEMSFIPHFFWH